MQTRRLAHLRGGANDVRQPEPSNDDQLWVIDIGGGQLRLARGSQELKALVVKLALPRETHVYALAATSRTLTDLPELESAFAPASDPVEAREPEPEPVATPIVSAPEPPVEQAEGASVVTAPEEVVEVTRPKRARDDEFERLDRSYYAADDYEPARPRRALYAGVGALVLLLGYAGYRLSNRSSAASVPVAAAPAPAAAPEPPPAPAVAPAPVPTAVPAPEPIAAPAVAVVAAPADPAAEELVGAVAEPSDSYAALVAAGQRQFESGRSKKAQALFEQALAVTPEGTAALIGLAYVLVDQGKLSQAVGVFGRALEQDHLNPKALFGLAESHRQQGNRRAALDEFKRFLSLQPKGNDADMARRLVAELTTGG